MFPYIFRTVLKVCNFKAKVKDYPRVKTQVNSALEHINVTEVRKLFGGMMKKEVGLVKNMSEKRKILF